jgi:hypothetical protein
MNLCVFNLKKKMTAVVVCFYNKICESEYFIKKRGLFSSQHWFNSMASAWLWRGSNGDGITAAGLHADRRNDME